MKFVINTLQNIFENVKSNFKIIVGGDFKLDPTRDSIFYEMLTDLFNTYNCLNIVNDFTRNSYIIDHIFTNTTTYCTISENNISDHKTIFMNSSFDCK